MFTAPHAPRFASQPRCGVGARILRQFGGAVRNVVAGGLTFAGVLRRPAASRPGIGHAVARIADARPAPGRATRTPRPRPVSPVAPSRAAQPGWLTRWFGQRSSRDPAPISHPLFADDDDAPFTPEAFPGLSPEFCTILNTPLEECDPEILRVLVAAFAETIVRHMPPEAGLTDAGSLFSTVWGRLAAVLNEDGLDAPPYALPPAAPAETPITRAETFPDVPVILPIRPRAALSPALTEVPSPARTEASSPALAKALPEVPLVSPASPPGAHAAHLPRHAQTTAVGASETPPDTVFLPGPARHGRTQGLCCELSLLNRIILIFSSRLRLSRRWRSLVHGFLLQRALPRFWCYAARASPL